MSTTIQIKRSSTASAIPVTGDIAVGELAVNLVDKRLFTKKADGTIIELSTNPTDLDAATLRIDGVEITASATELNKLDGFTGSTTELNTLDGITASTAELNKLDGYTGSTAELNLLDGVTATTAELNFVDGVTSNIQTQLSNKQPLDAQLTDISILIPTDGSFIVADGTNFVTESGDTAIASLGVTATAAELNTLDGITATTAELNITDGLTATTTELNTLDGITASTTELNYTDGVTSNIQTQLNGKATTAQGALADSAVQPLDSVEFNTGSFTSVDVTGTVTADGLTVDGATTLDSGSATPLVITRSGGTSGNVGLKFDAPTSGFYAGVASTSEDFVIGWNANLNTRNGIRVTDGGDVSFYEDTGTTAKMVWDASAERLGVGTSSPTNKIQTSGSAGLNNTIASFESNVFTRIYGDSNFGGNLNWSIDTPLRFSTSADNFSGFAERMRIDSTGNVGIGTASPERPLHIASATPYIVFEETDASQKFSLGSGGGKFFLYDETDSAQRLTVDSAGNVGIGTASPSQLLDVSSASNPAFHITNTDGTNGSTLRMVMATNGAFIGLANPQGGSDVLRFGTGNEQERARIDSSGNLLVGKTSADNTTTGVRIGPSFISVTSSANANTAIFNRTGPNDGEVVRFAKDGATVGSIGSNGGYTYFVGNNSAGFAGSGLLFGSNTALPVNRVGTSTDGVMRLGTSSNRFSDLYLSGGVKGNNLTFSGNGSSEHARIDSSGNLVVGMTAPSNDTAGMYVRPSSSSGFVADDTTVLSLCRLNGDGTIANFLKDGATVGSIGSYSGGTGNLDVSSGGTTSKLRLQNMVEFIDSKWSANEQIAPTRAGVNIGSSGVPFEDLYLSGGVYLGGTGAANKLDDYETGTWTPTLGGTWTTDPTLLSGTYVKIGSLVYVKVTFSGGAKASAGAGWIDGCPFNQVGSGATGSVSDSSVGDKGNCLFANTTRIWLTGISFSGTVYLSGSYNTDA